MVLAAAVLALVVVWLSRRGPGLKDSIVNRLCHRLCTFPSDPSRLPQRFPDTRKFSTSLSQPPFPSLSPTLIFGNRRFNHLPAGPAASFHHKTSPHIFLNHLYLHHHLGHADTTTNARTAAANTTTFHINTCESSRRPYGVHHLAIHIPFHPRPFSLRPASPLSILLASAASHYFSRRHSTLFGTRGFRLHALRLAALVRSSSTCRPLPPPARIRIHHLQYQCHFFQFLYQARLTKISPYRLFFIYPINYHYCYYKAIRQAS